MIFTFLMVIIKDILIYTTPIKKKSKITQLLINILHKLLLQTNRTKKSMILSNLSNRISIELLRLIWIPHFWFWDVQDLARP
mgnify:CR=1 FL=1